MKRSIALISEHASPLAAPGGVDCGGQNVYVFQLARHLAQAGHAVDVFSRCDDPDVGLVRPGPSGSRVWQVPAGPKRTVPKEDILPFMDEFTRFMVEHCERQGVYDVIHANFWMSGLVGCRLKQTFGTPLVTTFHALGRVRLQHQGAADRFPKKRLEIEDQIVAESDRLIAECPQDQFDLMELYGATREQIRIVGCGFDPDEFWPVDRQQARKLLGWDQHELIILQLGRLVPRKGIDNVIRGLAHLVHDRSLPARLVVVGGEATSPDCDQSPEMGRLTALAQELGIADRVDFAGRRDRDVLRFFYSAADVFVTTPWYEPFGITPLESMACGIPVIGSRVGGIKYTVVHGKTGFLVDPQDPIQLADRLHALLVSPQLRQAMRANCLERVNSLFTWERSCAAIAAVYEEICLAAGELTSEVDSSSKVMAAATAGGRT
ncbi:MAG TPA: glycosyltransferase family 1 protein [Planctomycetaceae bacterium]